LADKVSLNFRRALDHHKSFGQRYIINEHASLKRSDAIAGKYSCMQTGLELAGLA